MCSQSGVKLIFKTLGVLKAMGVIFMIVVGSLCCSQVNFQLAFGEHMVGLGAAIIVLAIFVAPNMYVGYHGASEHNRFYLTVHVVFELAIMLSIFIVAFTLFGISAPTHDLALKSDCILNEPESATAEACQEFLQSDRTAGMRLVWLNTFLNGRSDAQQYQLLSEMQKEYDCCGFGPPLRCETDTRPYPPDRPASALPNGYGSQRQFCGPEEDFYVELEADECVHYVDVTVVPPVVGGCRMDFPVGECAFDEVGGGDSGCMVGMEAYMMGQVDAFAWGLVAVGIMALISFVAGCCLCWKRKKADAMPDYINKEPWDPFAKKQKRTLLTLDADEEEGSEDQEDPDDIKGNKGGGKPAQRPSDWKPTDETKDAKGAGATIHP